LNTPIDCSNANSSELRYFFCAWLQGDLILYSWKDKRIISEVTDVGGGHRRWDLRFQEGDVTFSYIRDKEIYYSRISFDDCIDSILKVFPNYYLTVYHDTVRSQRNCNLHLCGFTARTPLENN
jgi:hypothetical protein